MTSTATSTRPITSLQLDSFARDGFLVVRGLLRRDEVQLMRDAFMAQAALGPVPGMFDGRPDAAASDPLARYPRMMHPHRQRQLEVGEISHRYMLDERIETVLGGLLGEQPIAAQSMFYFKPPGARGQALHQDNFYLRVRPHSCIAAWMALDDADRENGGMIAVPGSHRLPIACPEQADPTISFTNDFVRTPAGMSEQPIDLEAGDVLFFGGSVIHGSYPNTSTDRFRRAFICHYQPASATECSEWYRPLLDFDGTVVERSAAVGGGPCGTDAAEAATPH
ncbi:MAG: phytanoyl-CoA dioxygenase family protein [Planctomycetes bacterium]|nr:phytanoyl-CoA dioxygenase family protein [Planctomycetota bacterium]